MGLYFDRFIGDMVKWYHRSVAYYCSRFESVYLHKSLLKGVVGAQRRLPEYTSIVSVL